MRKAVWACLPFAAAIFLHQYLLPDRPVPWAALCCLPFVGIGFLLRGRARLCVLLAAFGALAGSLAFWCQARFVLEPCEEHVGEIVTVSARVKDYPDVYERSEYVTVRLTQPGLPRVDCRLASYVPGELEELVPGDEFVCEIRLQSALMRSGQETDAYTSQGIFLRAVCTQEPEITGRWRFSFLFGPKKLARAVVDSCARLFPADSVSFMTALLTGEKGPLYEDGDRYYLLSEAGLAHVVAVSGMHISFLLGAFFLLTGRRRAAVIAAIPLLIVFAAMTGFTPSVTRAMFMQSCVLAAPLFRREEDTATSLVIVLALLLLLNPSAAGSVSLQLSFASVAGIRLFSERMYRAAEEKLNAHSALKRRWLRRALLILTGSACTSLGALILTAPLAAAHFGSVSTVSPVSNVLCLWMISILYIGGYAAVLLGALFPAAGAMAGSVLAWGVRYVYAVAGGMAYLPCESVYTTNPLFTAWMVFVYLLFLLAWWMGKKNGGFRPAAPVCLSLIALYLCAGAVRLGWSREIRLTALDVGQGESVVLACGPHAVLVDCGGTSVPNGAGETAVRFLGGQQRFHLDALVLTHLHSDHVNGAARVLSQLRVDTLFLPLEEDQDGYLPEILAAAKDRGTRVEYVTENIVLKSGDMEITLFAPQLPGGMNENCLMVLAAKNGFETLICGDSPSSAELLLTARYELPDIEVLVTGHHGSRTSTCPELLEETRPDLAIVSVGYNTYGHPSREVLSRLESYSIPVLRTDQDGHITVAGGG